MWFGELPSKDCNGGILAHSLRTTGRRISKGTVLDQGMIAELVDAGHHTLTIARPDADDLDENTAATQLAVAACGSGVRAEKAHTGRVNIYAAVDGLLHFNGDAVVAANSISEDITISVLAHNQWVLKGRMIASAKIIPYAVPQPDLDKAVALIGESNLAVQSPTSVETVLIQTVQATVKPATLDKTKKVTEQRLQVRASSLIQETRCEHDVTELCSLLIESLKRSPQLILIIGASAISDRRDVLPSAVERAGGVVKRVGLPVDPGNLLMLAEIGDVPVLGLPGCARSPKHNGFDLLLDRIVCGIPITDEWINQLCIGGLLGEVHDRPQPRVTKIESESKSETVAALVLAAGSSRRAGKTNKLLHPYKGAAMVCTVVDSVTASKVSAGLVVTGHQHREVERALKERSLEISHCPNHSDGMAHTIAFGLSRLQSFDAVLVCLGDMPHVDGEIIDRIIAAPESVADKITVPVYNGQRGNPVMVGRAFFDSLLRHEGDTGARFLIKQYPEQVFEVEVDSDCILQDYDTQDALQQLDQT